MEDKEIERDEKEYPGEKNMRPKNDQPATMGEGYGAHGLNGHLGHAIKHMKKEHDCK